MLVRAQQYRNTRRPIRFPNKDFVQLCDHTCWNLHSLITLEIASAHYGARDHSLWKLRQMAKCLRWGSPSDLLPYQMVSNRLEVIPLTSRPAAGVTTLAANFTLFLMSLTLGKSPRKRGGVCANSYQLSITSPGSSPQDVLNKKDSLCSQGV